MLVEQDEIGHHAGCPLYWCIRYPTIYTNRLAECACSTRQNVGSSHGLLVVTSIDEDEDEDESEEDEDEEDVPFSTETPRAANINSVEEFPESATDASTPRTPIPPRLKNYADAAAGGRRTVNAKGVVTFREKAQVRDGLKVEVQLRRELEDPGMERLEGQLKKRREGKRERERKESKKARKEGKKRAKGRGKETGEHEGKWKKKARVTVW
ncbi:hypothetical protein BDN72DRAFT_903420 [Pluteus cervinus]|uniref:Uncharacterized protein n=1 Tax=Pluteus cervinus TaxID=181527 RepID=A0ACD3A9C9_9AGAR|nr:hypothetical protein BDN72DRAFT_903420 [Pluteus cervinus]